MKTQSVKAKKFFARRRGILRADGSGSHLKRKFGSVPNKGDLFGAKTLKVGLGS